MKLSLLLLFLILSLSNQESPDSFAQFQSFTRKYDKKYPSLSEYFHRYTIFKSNLDIINNQSQQSSYKIGITPFSDLTTSEFKQKYTHPMKSQITSSTRTSKKFLQDPPENFNWIDQGALPKDIIIDFECQSYGWAALESTEAYYSIMKKKYVKGSRQQILECDPDQEFCSGGSVETSFRYLMRYEKGLMKEEDYPRGPIGECKLDKEKIYFELAGIQKIGSNDEDELKKDLFEDGPLTATMNSKPLQFYVKGIIDDKDCDPSFPDHAVLIVGYGVENGTDFWIVRNSWGPRWGENGYFRIIRGKGECGINNDIIVPF